MSLDFSLLALRKTEVFDRNVTHNLTEMADEAGIYDVLWCPVENGFTHADQIISVLEEGLRDMKMRREHYEQFNPSNGWGSYECFVSFVQDVLDACYANPDAEISVCK